MSVLSFDRAKKYLAKRFELVHELKLKCANLKNIDMINI